MMYTRKRPQSIVSYFASYQTLQCQQIFIHILILLQLICNISFGLISVNTTSTQTDICTCACITSNMNISQNAATSVKEAYSKAEVIEKELTVEKNSTSFSTRAKISITDNRPSAKSLGVVAIVFISVIFACIVLLDIGTFVIDMITNLKTKKKMHQDNVFGDGRKTSKRSTLNINCAQNLEEQHLENYSKSNAPAWDVKEHDFQEGRRSSVIPNSKNDSNSYLSVQWPLPGNHAPISTHEEDTSQSLKFLGDHIYHQDSQTVRIRTLVPSHESSSEA